MLSLDQLHVDVLEHISNFLSAEDLARCCAVSRSWRKTFNQNLFWKKRCDENLLYLKTAKCQVRPHFQSNYKKTRLAPVGEWRLQYMREQHLWGNWRAGRYMKHHIIITAEKVNNVIAPIYGIIPLHLHGNDFILHFSIWFGTRIVQGDLWDVANKEPITVKACPLPISSNYVIIFDGVLVVNRVESNIIVVLNTDTEAKQISFSRAFIFDKPEELSSKIKEPEDIDKIFNEDFISSSHKRPQDIYLNIHGDLLLGSTYYLDNQAPVLHIWNYKTGKKLKKLSYALGEVDLTGFKFVSTSAQCQYIPIGVSTDRCSVIRPHYTIRTFIFDVSQLDFLPYTIQAGYTPELIHDNQVWCTSGTSLSCFNLTQTPVVGLDLEPIFTLKHHTELHNILAINGSIIFREGNNKFLIFNKSRLTLDLLVEIGSWICSAEVLCGKFLLLSSMRECHFIEIRSNNLIKLFNIQVTKWSGVHATNKSFTAFAIASKYARETLTFW